ncbi:MAG: type II toxin-antitoxin system RelE/ParE family toxin [Flavobacteriaceae bacterium]|nr:type II toxin-antitoxin system RelE/ParE family toxin [Flavobacteriaceae bacterium]
MIIEYTSPALRDLEELRIYLTGRSLSGLQNVIADIQEATISVSQSLSKGRKTSHDKILEKISPKYGYLLPYYIKGDTIYILRVYHPSRKPLDYQKIRP